MVGAGGGRRPTYLHLLFCKSVYIEQKLCDNNDDTNIILALGRNRKAHGIELDMILVLGDLTSQNLINNIVRTLCELIVNFDEEDE